MQGSATKIMNKEQLIAKGIKHKFNGKETLFQVESLNKHFDGLVIHESDILTDEFEGQDDEYVKASDVNFDSATPNIVLIEEAELDEDYSDNLNENKGKPDGMTFEEAEKILNDGNLIALPEWEGFWFKNMENGEILVLTKDGEILDTPWEGSKQRTDWKKVEATQEQEKILENYWSHLASKEIKVVDPVIESNKVENLEPVIPAAKEEILKTEDVGLPKPKEPKATTKKSTKK